jgi:hypothetical protein
MRINPRLAGAADGGHTPPWKKAALLDIEEQLNRGGSLASAFLHIPKTGGRSLKTVFEALERRGQAFPVRFGHAWTLREIIRHYPAAKVSFLLRDPLERAVSGFNSRLRQGRPHEAGAPWSPAEAAAFGIFRDVTSYLRALLSQDDFLPSAALYASQHIMHLRWNYRYYFESSAAVDEMRGAIAHVGRVEAPLETWKLLFADHGQPAAFAAQQFHREHVSARRPEEYLAEFGPDEIARLRKAMREDYAIFGKLTALAAEPPSP